MKNFIQYINAISKQPYLAKKAKHTTAILMPEMDTPEGIYRSILPSYVINGVQNDCRMIIAGMSARVNVSHNSKNFHIDKQMVQECDHIVFPFVSQSLRQIIDEIRTFKPTMKFSYYIDANYYLMPNTFPFAKEYNTAKMIETIEDNIKAVDQVIVTNKHLIDYIIGKLSEKYPGQKFGTNFFFQRLFILPEIMKTEYSNEPAKGTVNALIIGDDYHFSDINYISGILKNFKEKYKAAFNLTIIGWNGKRNERVYLPPTMFTHYERVPFDRYFETIQHIGPSVLIIPGNKNKFNDTSKNYIKYLEFAYMNIPVIAPDIQPYSDIIKTNENGFLCPDKETYEFQLETILSEPAKFEGSLGLAYATAIEYNIADKSNIEKLVNIYFPDNGK